MNGLSGKPCVRPEERLQLCRIASCFEMHGGERLVTADVKASRGVS